MNDYYAYDPNYDSGDDEILGESKRRKRFIKADEPFYKCSVPTLTQTLFSTGRLVMVSTDSARRLPTAVKRHLPFEEGIRGEQRMPANVETMMYVREKPWHGLGTEVLEAPTSADALRLAGPGLASQPGECLR